MEAFPILVLAFLAVYIMPSALAVQCYLCNDVPNEFPGVSKCDSNDMGNITCSSASEGCMTVKVKMTMFPKILVSRNCTSGMSCDPQSNKYICKAMRTPELDHCEARCCQGNMCDPYQVSTSTTSSPHPNTTSSPHPTDAHSSPPQPTAASTLPAASFGAIVIYFALNMFV